MPIFAGFVWNCHDFFARGGSMASPAEFKCVESKKTGRFSIKRHWIVQNHLLQNHYFFYTSGRGPAMGCCRGGLPLPGSLTRCAGAPFFGRSLPYGLFPGIRESPDPGQKSTVPHALQIPLPSGYACRLPPPLGEEAFLLAVFHVAPTPCKYPYHQSGYACQLPPPLGEEAFLLAVFHVAPAP